MTGSALLDIPLFDVPPRLGRLRYSVNIGGLALLAATEFAVCWVLFKVFNLHVTAVAAIVLLLILDEILYLILSVRRLHDAGRSGWWVVIIVALQLWFLAMVAYAGETSFHPFWRTIAPSFTTYVACFTLLLWLPGDADGNEYGPVPAPSPGWMKWIACAWVCVLLISATGFVADRVYRMQMRRGYVANAIARAISAEALWRNYFRAHQAWPEPYEDPDALSLMHHMPGGWYWRSKDGSTFVIDAPVLDEVMGDYPGGVNLPGAAVWTTDGGETWHCGPYSTPPDGFPKSCLETGTPAYNGPI